MPNVNNKEVDIIIIVKFRFALMSFDCLDRTGVSSDLDMPIELSVVDNGLFTLNPFCTIDWIAFKSAVEKN